jgi:hypothetical protein
MRVVVPWDRVALGLELPVLPGKPLPNPGVRAREFQAARDGRRDPFPPATTW